jgi:hypothetical protein
MMLSNNYLEARFMKRTDKTRKTHSFIRAFAVVTAMSGLVSGVTFAGLQSQQNKLAGNSIQTATANLLVSTDNTTYSNTQPGYSFSNLIPGGSAVPTNGYPLYLKNAGGAPLSLKVAVSSPPTNQNNADLAKVYLILNHVGGGTPQIISLAALIAAANTGGVPITTPSAINPGLMTQYNIQVSMDQDAITGSVASIGNLDLSFTGTVSN